MTALETLTPREIVAELDRYIIGQLKAKKAVAIALRNRVRRQKLPKELRDEVAPKNIIMIGPTGVGKTEIARRLAKLCGAPFIKVEATKYTEVGYVGRDVESMVRDLMSVAMSMVKEELRSGVQAEAERRVEDHLLDLLLPGLKKSGDIETPFGDGSIDTREVFRKKLREGRLDEREVEIQVSSGGMPSLEILTGNSNGLEDMDINLGNLGNLGSIFGGKKKKKITPVHKAREILLAEEIDRLIDTDKVADIARDRVQEMGIIFIDEIDKIASREGKSGIDVSREGVQRDILPIVEGSKVTTKHGMIDTSHILFIAAGAFHISKPSDLIPELQGRFPLRVELEALTAEDFEKILTQPENALITQYVALMGTEGVELSFTPEAILHLSRFAADVNSRTENIGARRLHTILELVLEDLSFEGPERSGETIAITEEYVRERLKDVVQDQDLSRYIL